MIWFYCSLITQLNTLVVIKDHAKHLTLKTHHF